MVTARHPQLRRLHGADEPHRGGRPRSAEADQAIVDATLDLIAEEGLNALSVEAVAVRAGVGKATIYRRWPSKEALVEAALGRMNDSLSPAPVEGPLRERLVVLVEEIRCKSSETHGGRILPRMLAYGPSHPELFEMFYRQVITPRRARFQAVLTDAITSGDLPPDTDVDLAVTLLAAPMLYLNMMQSAAGAPEPRTSESLVDCVLQGLAPR